MEEENKNTGSYSSKVGQESYEWGIGDRMMDTEIKNNFVLEIPTKYLTKIENMEEEKCKGQHLVDGKTPQITDIHLDSRTCSCGKVKYVKEECGCPSNVEKTYTLKQYPNE